MIIKHDVTAYGDERQVFHCDNTATGDRWIEVGERLNVEADRAMIGTIVKRDLAKRATA